MANPSVPEICVTQNYYCIKSMALVQEPVSSTQVDVASITAQELARMMGLQPIAVGFIFGKPGHFIAADQAQDGSIPSKARWVLK